MFRRLSIWVIIILLFAGNIGISVYNHICSKDGVFTSLYFPNDSHCQEKQNKLPPCCQKKKIKKSNCCHNETKIFKLKADYSNTCSKIDLSIKSISISKDNLLAFFSVEVANTESKKFSGHDPPPLIFGREILIQNQVFRI